MTDDSAANGETAIIEFSAAFEQELADAYDNIYEALDVAASGDGNTSKKIAILTASIEILEYIKEALIGHAENRSFRTLPKMKFEGDDVKDHFIYRSSPWQVEVYQPSGEIPLVVGMARYTR